MQMQGYQQYAAEAPRAITTQDKLVRVAADGTETVVHVLLTRPTHLVCREESATAPKFELLFTTWTQERGNPPQSGAAVWKLFVPEGSVAPSVAPAADVPPAPKRGRATSGESKLDKCRTIYAANKQLDRAAVQKLFVEQAGCTEGGANTYYLLIRKELG